MNSLALGRFLALLAVLCCLSPLASGQISFLIDPRETYLRTNADPNAWENVPIYLPAIGVLPGDIVLIESLGSYHGGSSGANRTDMLGMFSNSWNLDPPSSPARVPGAIDAGLDVVSVNTREGNLPTDIPQDFSIGSTRIQVPASGLYLFVCPNDNFFGDNTDANSDYAVRITLLTRQYVFTSNAYIGPNDLTYEGGDIIVRGCTVTIDGSHQFYKLTVEPNAAMTVDGIVTTTGAAPLSLSVETDVEVKERGRIDLSSKGYPARSGPGRGLGASTDTRGGGASHGGRGGNGALFGTSDCYGSITEPTEMGSGGGAGNNGVDPPGAGGGALRLTVGGQLKVDGRILANGGTCFSNWGGGGSGGSLWISVGQLSGSGSMQVLGGNVSSICDGDRAGGGGGGRMAIYYGGSTFLGSFEAAGGYTGCVTNRRGGAGTILLKQTGQRAQLIIDNGGYTGAGTEFQGIQNWDCDVLVRQGAILTHPAKPQGQTNAERLQIHVTGNFVIEQGAFVHVDARGYTGRLGPGAGLGPRESHRGGGGSYGGRGSNGALHNAGECYGSMTEPMDLGSGGGAGDNDNNPPGAGGGALKLVVAGQLRVDGRLSANGGTCFSNWGGGGSGGSLWLNVGHLAGTGSIQTLGGNVSSICDGDRAGGGGGGRMAIYYGGSDFTGQIQAFGGYTGCESIRRGGAGTIYMKQGSQRAQLILDNGGFTGSSADFSGTQTIDADVIVRRGASLSHPPRLTGQSAEEHTHLMISGDVLVEEGGWISTTGRGFGHRSGLGRGLGSEVDCCGGGAGYGGRGANGRDWAGGQSYGSAQQPIDLGSGGGGGSNGGCPPGYGGGALRLTIAGRFTVDGRLESSGNNSSCNGGAGSGGSIWVSAREIAGVGFIRANGGANGDGNGGGGGGGRIALYYDTNTFTGVVESLGGGSGSRRGFDGSIHTGPRGVPGDTNGDGCVDDVDLASVLSAFGTSCTGCGEDVNGDGVVDDSDLATVLSNFGLGC
ncbi:MAG: hypothetical protein HUU60_06055 [Armatimonadetes bacterium]|nr:hypothetical protein [Armatimonadota bacterium]